MSDEIGEWRTYIHISNISVEAEFTVRIDPDGSAVFELKEPIRLPPGTFRIGTWIKKEGR